MPERLFRTLAAHPQRIALRTGRRALCAGELLAWVDALAASLSGVRVVAVLADNGPAWVALDLAALRAGVAHLPLPGFFSPAQMAHALELAGADCALSDAPDRLLALNLGFAVCGEVAGLHLLRRDTPLRPLPVGTAKISFTSGSTGQPRGVCLTAAGLVETAAAVSQALADMPLPRHLSVLPLALLLENVAGVYAALLHGAEVVLPGLTELGWRGMAGCDPRMLTQGFAAWQPASAILVPELLKAWCHVLEATQTRAPASLALVAVGGARVAPELLVRARACGIPAYEGYGLTEGGSVLCLNLPGVASAGGVGRPLGHASVRVDTAGEIHVAGQLALGYLGEPPFPKAADGRREFATGDLGHLDAQGHLHLQGRRKHLLITAYGRNVSPEWVEAALTAEPEILHAVVAGEGQPWLAALIAPMPGAAAAAVAGAVARANAGLPDYAQIRAWVSVPPFSHADGLATGNGRPQRSAILNRYAPHLTHLFTQEPTHVVL